jgi:hypothetical protein
MFSFGPTTIAMLGGGTWGRITQELWSFVVEESIIKTIINLFFVLVFKFCRGEESGYAPGVTISSSLP